MSSEQENIRVRLIGINGDLIDAFLVCPGADGQDLLDQLSHQLRLDRAALGLMRGAEVAQRHLFMYDVDSLQEAELMLARLPIPAKHDGVQQCDVCDFWRYCHYSYAWSPVTEDYEAVGTLCEPCGGTHTDVASCYAYYSDGSARAGA